MSSRRPQPVTIEGYIASITLDPPDVDGLYRWRLEGNGRAAFLGRIGEPMVRAKALERIKKWESETDASTPWPPAAKEPAAEKTTAPVTPAPALPTVMPVDRWIDALLSAFRGVPPVGTYQLHDPASAIPALVAAVRAQAVADTITGATADFSATKKALEDEVEGLVARLNSVNEALATFGVDPNDELEEGPAIEKALRERADELSNNRMEWLGLESLLAEHGFRADAERAGPARVRGALMQALARATGAVVLTEEELLARASSLTELKRLESDGFDAIASDLAATYRMRIGPAPSAPFRKLVLRRAEALRSHALHGQVPRE